MAACLAGLEHKYFAVTAVIYQENWINMGVAIQHGLTSADIFMCLVPRNVQMYRAGC